jgi:sterol desaturase/sphingolipid hydroxylase (fatty acid hydroxylase superfamily)
MLESLLFVATILLCWTAENLVFPTGLERKRRRAGINASFVLVALPIQAGMSTLCVAAAAWVEVHHWGLLYLLPAHDHWLLKYGAMFVFLDFLDYVYHRAMHHVPFLWRLHLVHHTDRAVDASTTVREHPGETVFRNAFLILWVILCGASLEILLLRQAVETLSNILSHSSLLLPGRLARPLGWLLITPNLHHVHHHSRLPYTNTNYGDVFSIWDRMFMTVSDHGPAETDFGLDTHMPARMDDGFRRALAMPFD